MHCTDLSCGLWHRCDSICTVFVSAELGAAKHGAAISTVFIRWERHRGDTASLNLIFWIKQNCEIIRLMFFNMSEKDIYDTFHTVSSNQSVSFNARRWILIKSPRCDGINLYSCISEPRDLVKIHLIARSARPEPADKPE